MAHLDVVQAVEARLQAGFQRCPVKVENSYTGTPDAAGPFVLVDFPWSRSEWITADEWQEEGAFRVLLALPSGEGAHEGRAWLDEIASLFRGKLFDGIQCYAPQSAASDDQSDRGSYFRLALTVPYEFILSE